MERALDDAPTPADRAFVLVQLGELAFNAGRPAAALERYNAALAAMPTDAAALAGKARVESSLDQVETALDDYARLVSAAPEPSYLLDYGDLLASLGRDREAAEQYRIFTVTQQLFGANGVQPDAVLDVARRRPRRPRRGGGDRIGGARHEPVPDDARRDGLGAAPRRARPTKRSRRPTSPSRSDTAVRGSTSTPG